MSRSPRDNIVFQEMRSYLTELIMLAQGKSSANASSSTECSKYEDRDQDGCYPPPCKRQRQQAEGTAVVSLDLLTFLIDIAGIVREKSQFKVYTNHCYMLSKTSKPAILDVHATDSS